MAALANSFGAINHGYHEWLWIGFCFVFLPVGSIDDVARTRRGRMSFLMTFGMAQGLILLFYSLSGFFKVATATRALVLGEVGGFSPEAMAITLANRMLETNTDALWAPIIIENPLLGWPFYLGLHYIEFVSIMIWFRPDLHRLWGLFLIGFHFGTALFMEITFASHALINAMLFVFSPFAPSRFNWPLMVWKLPIFGFPIATFVRAIARRGIGSNLL